jgi:hypothetical protein
MSVMEMVTVKALETMTIKARIRMVRYCLNDAIRLVVMGYVDLGWLICDRWDPRDLISHGFGYRRSALRKGHYSKSARVNIRC